MSNDHAVFGIRWPVDPADRETARIGGTGSLYETILAPSQNQMLRRRWYTFSDLAKLAWHHVGFIAIGAATGLLLGTLASLAFPRLYQASALLYALGADDAAMQGEVSILLSEDVLHATVAELKPSAIVAAMDRSAPFGFLFPHCTTRIKYASCVASLLKPGLDVQLDGNHGNEQVGRVLRLSARFTDPALATSTVDAVITADHEARRIAYVTTRAAAIALQLQDASAQAMELASEASAIRKETGVLDIGQAIAVAIADASNLARRESQVRERQGAVGAALAQTQAQLHVSPEIVLGSREVSSGIPAPGLNSVLLQLQLERAHMVQLYAPSYQGILELNRKIAAVEGAARTQVARSASVTRDIRNPGWDRLSSKVASLQSENEALARQLSELDRQSELMAKHTETLRWADTKLSALRQRQEVQEAVVQQLSIEMTTLRVQDTLTETRADELRVVQRPSVQPVPWTGMPTTAAIGLTAGLLAGITAAARANRRRSFYLVAREAERHLNIPELAEMTLWKSCDPRSPPQQQARELAMRLLDLSDDSGGRLSAIHLVGTEEADGAHLVAHALAIEIGILRQIRVAVLCLGRDKHGDIQSVASLTAPDALGADGGAHSWEPLANAPRASGGLIKAMLQGREHGGEPLRLQIARLREMQDLLLVISSHGLGHRATRQVSKLSDLDVIVVRARSTRVDAAHRLARGLAAAGIRPVGFASTNDSSGPLDRFLDRRTQCV